MKARRALLTGLGGIALAAGAWSAGACRATSAAAEARMARRGSVIRTGAGPLEFAVAGHGEPLMMIHGAGGGFDQGLLFAHGLREAGFRIVAPSRFGHLRSAFPEDASSAREADVLVDLLDHLGLERIAVAGGSAGALTAAEFALRHPDRCTRLILIVPAANLTGRDPVAFTALQRMAVERVLNSDAWFWGFATLAPEMLLRTLLATDPALLDRVSTAERQRADLIREGLMPIGRKTDGLRNDGFRAGAPAQTAFGNIPVPTLILSCEDDLFGTANTARQLAERIPDACLFVFPDGGHVVGLKGNPEFTAIEPQVFDGGAVTGARNVATRVVGKVARNLAEPFPELGAQRTDYVWCGHVGMNGDRFPRVHQSGRTDGHGSPQRPGVALGREMARPVGGAPVDQLALPVSTPSPYPVQPLLRRVAPTYLAWLRRKDLTEPP